MPPVHRACRRSGRLIEPAEIAELVAFLLSPAAAAITGQEHRDLRRRVAASLTWLESEQPRNRHPRAVTAAYTGESVTSVCVADPDPAHLNGEALEVEDQSDASIVYGIEWIAVNVTARASTARRRAPPLARARIGDARR